MRKKENEKDKMFMECIGLMRDSIEKMSEKYPLEVVNSALIELGLRMSMIQGGSYHTIRVFAGVMNNIATFGQLMEKDIAQSIKAGLAPDPFDDWEYTATKKTIH
jgi:hypothetical protein